MDTLKFSNLPAEIILLIAEACSTLRNINALASTCHELYSCLLPYLYALDAKRDHLALNGSESTLGLALQYGKYHQLYILENVLQEACSRGYIEKVKLVLQKQFLEDLRTTTIHERSLVRLGFWKAIEAQHLEIISFLLDIYPGLHPDHALKLAQEQPRTLNFLKDTFLERGKSIKRPADEIAFLNACCQGNHEEVIRLLRKGVSTDLEDQSGNTPLMIAVRIGHVPLFKTLLGHGGLTYMLPPDNLSMATLLFEGYEGPDENRIQIVKALLEEKVPFDRDCALRKAIRRYKIDMVKLLIPHISDINKEWGLSGMSGMTYIWQ
ncbi:hypothetical protein EIK77_008795 [Talaromyces pinophilus]|nr:hypothetical protein EIK77_008795 [Talaromyces pinophilus]